MLSSSSTGGDGERIVVCVGQVAAPEGDDDRSEVVVGMGTQQGIELLGEGVGLVPPGLTLS